MPDPEIVEIIDQTDGGRILLFDNGTRVHEEPPTFEIIDLGGGPGLGTHDRGLGDQMLLARDPGAMGVRQDWIRPGNADDMNWLRYEIQHGNITRESRPSRVPTDQYLGAVEHDGWNYMIGRRTGITVARPVGGRLAPDLPIIGSDDYLWGVRGSEAARAAWARDHRRAVGIPILSDDTQSALADRGLPPEGPFISRSTHDFSWSDIPQGLMEISRAALQAQESFRRYTDRLVERYNGEPYGSVVAIFAGIIEFGFRIVTDIIGLPAAIGDLFEALGEVFDSLRAAAPDLMVGLRDAPVATLAVVLEATYDAIIAVTGLGEIGDEFSRSVELAESGRDAESSLAIIRGTGRVIELLLIVRALASALRRIPAVVRRMRTGITRITQSVERLRAARRVVGQRLNAQLRRVWRSVINDLDRRDLAEIRRLLRRAEQPGTSAAVQQALREGAYQIAREYLYPRVAGRFWNHIRRTPRLAHIFEEAGLTLRADRVPAWILEDGREVRLSIEHLTRVSDNPLLCIDPTNLSIVPLAENSHLLEAIRAIRRYAELAAGGGG